MLLKILDNTDMLRLIQSRTADTLVVMFPHD